MNGKVFTWLHDPKAIGRELIPARSCTRKSIGFPSATALPVVLCYLEGLTHDQAAHKLGWPLGTVESRLARARDRLRRRLEHRGALPGVALLGAGLLADVAKATVSSGWIEATARSATQFAAGKTAAAVASANVAFLTRETLHMMTLSQIKLAIALALAAAAGATGVVAIVRAVPAATSQPPRIAAIQPGPPAAERAKPPQPPIAPVTIKVRGRVLDPAGNPVQGSRLWLAFQGIDWTWSDRVPEVRADHGRRRTFRVHCRRQRSRSQPRPANDIRLARRIRRHPGPRFGRRIRSGMD